ncbi:MAG TPA: DUF5069 domain-containing protein [Limnochordia bacterium]|nr:DUF5069 domain-containing protein [Limnochordia bacterium]
MTEWKPRGRDVVIGGYPWLARMTDKARAKLDGTIGDYIYPCPIDRRVLDEYGISADDFLKIVAEATDDSGVIAAVKVRQGNVLEKDR